MPDCNRAAGRLATVVFPIGKIRYIWKVKRRDFPDRDIITLPVSLFVALAGVLKAAWPRQAQPPVHSQSSQPPFAEARPPGERIVASSKPDGAREFRQ